MLRQYHLLRTGLTLPMAVIALVSTYLASALWLEHLELTALDRLKQYLFERAGLTFSVHALVAVGGLTAVLAMAGLLVGSLRGRLALRAYGWVCVGLCAMVVVFAVAAGLHIGAVIEFQRLGNPKLETTNSEVFWAWWEMFWPAGFAGTIVVALQVFSMRRGAISVYTGEVVAEYQRGDEILENVRTHGRDPLLRKSFYSSAFLHWFLILGLPWLLGMWGCVERYNIPQGSGNPVVMLVKVVKPKKKEKQKLILRPDSAIYMKVPDLEDSEIEEQVKQETELTYEANPNALVGMIGEGGGEEGGWPEGTGREPIRFIRIKHRGSGWDDGMGSTGADAAFLKEFERITKFKTRDASEAHDAALLAKYPKGYAPPFIYLTGDGRTGLSSRDIKALREYCLDGGMLFADAGHRSFDRDFRSLMRQVFPGKQLRVIADDDPIFQRPYQFPNGAPPIWAHGGRKALGIKHKGRWCVFYHPGDLNDAWKDRRIHGLSKEMTDGAFEMGVNIVYYSFTNYLAETKKYRK